MKNTISILFIFSLLNGFAQKEGDKIVIGGIGPFPSAPFNKNNILYINENYGLDSVDGSQYLNMPLYDLDQSSSTFWKDSISYTSNGYKVVNQRGEIIVPKLYIESFIDSGQYMSLISQNSLFLNIKHDNQEKLFLFYGQYKWDLLPAFSNEYEMIFDTLFSYYELNTNFSTGSQSILSEKNHLLKDADSSARGGIVACRHANGRDWWIFKPGLRLNKFYRALLTPFEIVVSSYYTNANSQWSIAAYYSHFSADGKKFITIYDDGQQKKVYVYDFDRCTGELSNLQIHDVNSILYGTIYYSCLSPDGSKMYIYRYPYLPNTGDIAIIQYDFETQQTITFCSGNCALPFTSPNGKQVLYVTSVLDSLASFFGARIYISVVNDANNLAIAENLSLNVYELPNAQGFVPPNHANFRLGAAQGTVCDSLGLSYVAIEDEKTNWHLFPNPNNGQFSISFEKWQGGHYVLHNSLGQQVAQALLPSGEIHTLHLQNLQPGLYVITLFDQKKQAMGSKRLVVLQN